MFLPSHFLTFVVAASIRVKLLDRHLLNPEFPKIMEASHPTEGCSFDENTKTITYPDKWKPQTPRQTIKAKQTLANTHHEKKKKLATVPRPMVDSPGPMLGSQPLSLWTGSGWRTRLRNSKPLENHDIGYITDTTTRTRDTLPIDI